MPKKDNTHTPVRGNINTRRGASLQSPPQDISPLLVDATLNTYCSPKLENQVFLDELRALREEMRATRLQMTNLTTAIANLTQRMDECDLRVDKLTARVDIVERRLDQNPCDNYTNKEVLASIEQLKAEINDKDQDLLLNDLEISCVPEQKVESVQHIIVTLAGKLGVKLEDQDIVSANRVGRTPISSDGAEAPRPRLIVVRLARRTVRNQLLQAARVRRGATTEGTDLPTPPRRFYVNERLTQVNRQLFQRAREVAKRLNWRFVWTRDGRIYVRRGAFADSPRQRLHTMADITRVFGPDAVRSSEFGN
ncbi:uncharacterized protein LOC113231536 [Hyposmocoma kahamanoa]|uniref:uncharacterized protein LOC113231536 n=1 Tax=Hyposmocoma kahamanoa TaxID=1477025 RepID=UPI000E6D7459|nr:uncharacterized protein LOC113231536 [Hyposmocoma kahamanoa]